MECDKQKYMYMPTHILYEIILFFNSFPTPTEYFVEKKKIKLFSVRVCDDDLASSDMMVWHNMRF